MDRFLAGLKKILLSLPGQGLMSAILMISSVFAMFSTVPPLFTYTSEGRSRGVAVLLFGLVFTMLLAGFNGFVFYLSMIFFVTVVLGEFINSKVDFAKTLIISSVVVIAAYLIVIALYSIATPVSPKDLLIANVGKVLGSMELVYPDVFNNMLKESGLSKSEIIVDIATLLPGYVLITVVMFIFFNMVIVSRFHEHLKNFLAVHNLKTYRIPDVFVWPALVFSALYLYSSSSYNNDFYVTSVAVFLFKGIMIFYFLQGLGIVYVILQANMKSTFFRNIVISLVVVFAYMFVTAIGFFDTWFDFRKILRKGEGQ